MEKPKVTREKNKVILDCGTEKEAEACKQGIDKMFSSPVARMMIKRTCKKIKY